MLKIYAQLLVKYNAQVSRFCLKL